MELGGGGIEVVAVCCVDHVDDDVDAATVALPHTAEARLTANVPNFDRHIALLHFAHVETNCRDQVLRVVARG